MQHQSITINLHNCHNRWFICGVLPTIAAKGLSIQTTWINGGSLEKITCNIKSNGTLPDILYQKANHNDRIHDLKIIISHAHKLNLPLDSPIIKYISKQELGYKVNKLKTKGIPVRACDWEKVKQFGQRILVPATDISAQGAGGQ